MQQNIKAVNCIRHLCIENDQSRVSLSCGQSFTTNFTIPYVEENNEKVELSIEPVIYK